VIKLWAGARAGVQVVWDDQIAGFGFKGQAMAEGLNSRKHSAMGTLTSITIFTLNALVSQLRFCRARSLGS
jgi:hypothetical protein